MKFGSLDDLFSLVDIDVVEAESSSYRGDFRWTTNGNEQGNENLFKLSNFCLVF